MASRLITATLRNYVRKEVSEGYYYEGNVYGDTKGRWPDGRRIRTSLVKGILKNNNELCIVTLNSIYLLESRRRP